MSIPPGDVAPVILTITITVAVAATLILRGPIGRGLARAMEVGASAGTKPEDDPRIAQLEQRVAELETVQSRMAELEERLDFAERLLTRNEPAGRLPDGKGPP